MSNAPGRKRVSHHPPRKAPTKPTTFVAVPVTSGDAADQVIAVKQELYKLRSYILQLTHVEHRDNSLKHFEAAYNAFDKLQEFMKTRA